MQTPTEKRLFAEIAELRTSFQKLQAVLTPRKVLQDKIISVVFECDFCGYVTCVKPETIIKTPLSLLAKCRGCERQMRAERRK